MDSSNVKRQMADSTREDWRGLVAHVDDEGSLVSVLAKLRDLHGPTYEFEVGRWHEETLLTSSPGRRRHRFLVAAADAQILLQTGERVRGPSPDREYRQLADGWAAVVKTHLESLWPGDVICVDGADLPVQLTGTGTYFDVTTESTAYRAPRLALLRNLIDHPGGCAAYPGAFRREALPPERSPADSPDQRGLNRVNEHTLDMRVDRTPGPSRHCHGPVSIGRGRFVNHSETAIVLPRNVYGLPELAESDRGHIILHWQPMVDPSDTSTIPVQPGSIVVTTAGTDQVMGHRFENAFAMLVAIPGFVSPYRYLE